MRQFITLILLMSLVHSADAQVKIHAHNDFEKPRPLFDALQIKAFSIEADIFWVKGQFLVAHTLKETSKKKTLSSLYIEPIMRLFKKYNGAVSADSTYKTALVIDIKENGKEVLQQLVHFFEPLRIYFDRSLNPLAVQLIISGDRGPIAEWKEYPPYIYFDGRPFEEYDLEALGKIAMISDNYYKYLSRNNTGDTTKITDVVKKAHALNKPVRFWASPDSEAVWKLLVTCGADIINTDKPADCRRYFNEK